MVRAEVPAPVPPPFRREVIEQSGPMAAHRPAWADRATNTVGSIPPLDFLRYFSDLGEQLSVAISTEKSGYYSVALSLQRGLRHFHSEQHVSWTDPHRVLTATNGVPAVGELFLPSPEPASMDGLLPFFRNP